MSKSIKKELAVSQQKRTFEQPKLKFLKPKLTKQGDATKITANGATFNATAFNGFNGVFNP
jgi:hypothetical protein